MATGKSLRLEIGRRLFHQELSLQEAIHLYNYSDETLRRFVREYKETAGISGPGVVIDSSNSAYEEMTKDQLINEIMKKDIEVERLKKGYAVKGVGAEKEFVTTSDVNTK